MFKKFLKIFITIAIFSSPSFSFQSNSSTLVTNNPKEIIDQVWHIIYRDFLDYSGKYNEDNWIKLRKEILANKYLDNDDAYIAINEMLKQLDDPYTRFLDPKEFNEMRIDTAGELMGVGIQISLGSKNLV
jgi:carboxyl-terminal processing protease